MAEYSAPRIAPYQQDDRQCLDEHYRRGAKRWPDIYAIHSLNEMGQGQHVSMTFSELARCSDRLAHGLRGRGLGVGSVVAVSLENSSKWAILWWTVQRMGAIFVPLSRSVQKQPDMLSHMLSTCHADMLVMEEGVDYIVPPSVRMKVTAQAIAPAGWTSIFSLYSQKMHEYVRERAHSNQDPHFYFFTSGTTSLPKLVVRTLQGFLSMHAGLVRCLALKPEDRVMVPSPIAFVFPMYVVTHVLFLAGATTIFPGPFSNSDADGLVAALRLHRCTHFVTVPLLLSAVLDSLQYQPPLTNIKAFYVGGSKLSASIRSKCQKRLGSALALDAYGMSETGILSSQSAHLDDAKTLKGTGKVFFGKTIRIVLQQSQDNETRLADWDEAGEVHTCGDGVCTQYGLDSQPLVNMAEGTFYSDVDSGTGIMRHWFNTGDVGSLSEDGILTIQGRSKDMIIRGGVNISSNAIEAIIDECLGGYNSSQVVGFSNEEEGEDEIVAILSNPSPAPHDVDGLRKAIAISLGENHVPAHFIELQKDLKVDAFPLTHSYKLKRDALVDLVKEYMVAQKTTLQVSPRDSTTEAVTKLWRAQATLISPSKLDLERTLVTSLSDSIGLLQLCSTYHSVFKTTVNMAELMSNPTMAQQIVLIDHKREKHLELQQQPEKGKQLSTSRSVGEETFAHIRNLFLSWSWTKGISIETVAPLSHGMQKHLIQTTSSTYCRYETYAIRTSAEQVKSAIERLIVTEDVLRSIVLVVDGDQGDKEAFVVVLHPSKVLSCLLCEFFKDEEPLYQPGPCFRASIHPVTTKEECRLTIQMHHNLQDVMSFANFMEKLQSILLKSTYEPGPSFVDYCWTRYERATSSTAGERALAYHCERLSKLTQLMRNVPRTRNDIDLAKTYCSISDFALQEAQIDDLRRIQGESGVLPIAFVRAAYALLLARIAGDASSSDGNPYWIDIETSRSLIPDGFRMVGGTTESAAPFVVELPKQQKYTSLAVRDFIDEVQHQSILFSTHSVFDATRLLKRVKGTCASQVLPWRDNPRFWNTPVLNYRAYRTRFVDEDLASDRVVGKDDDNTLIRRESTEKVCDRPQLIVIVISLHDDRLAVRINFDSMHIDPQEALRNASDLLELVQILARGYLSGMSFSQDMYSCASPSGILRGNDAGSQ